VLPGFCGFHCPTFTERVEGVAAEFLFGLRGTLRLGEAPGVAEDVKGVATFGSSE
jgi:hypothetical protein